MVAFFHQHETQVQAEAREAAADMAQTLKELGDYQACILIALGVMIRSGANKASLEQIDSATAEYSKRFSKLMNYASSYRLSAPKAGNRY